MQQKEIKDMCNKTYLFLYKVLNLFSVSGVSATSTNLQWFSVNPVSS